METKKNTQKYRPDYTTAIPFTVSRFNSKPSSSSNVKAALARSVEVLSARFDEQIQAFPPCDAPSCDCAEEKQ